MQGPERSSFHTILYLMAIPLAGLAIFFFWQWIHSGEVSKPAAPNSEKKIEAKPVEVAPQSALPAVKPKRRHRGDIVLIIDDLGFDGQPLDKVMALDPNLNCSILPNGTRAAEFAEKLHARGFEVLCHLPMEPQGRETPGRNAILTSMSDEEIARTTRENIEAIPYARGVNNHMGSRATTDRRVMESVIRAMPDGLYFIDSRTTGGSIAEKVAREMNVRTASRSIFLDDVATEHSVRKQLAALATAAQTKGVAVGIGHPYPVTMRVLADDLPDLKAQGFRLVRASSVVR